MKKFEALERYKQQLQESADKAKDKGKSELPQAEAEMELTTEQLEDVFVETSAFSLAQAATHNEADEFFYTDSEYGNA